MAERIQRDKSVVSPHLKTVFESHSVVAKSATTALDGNTYKSSTSTSTWSPVGYRVKCPPNQERYGLLERLACSFWYSSGDMHENTAFGGMFA